MKDKRLLTLFLGCSIFILLPFIYSWQLQDIEQSPRFLSLGVIAVIAAVLTIFSVKNQNEPFFNDRLYWIVCGYILIHCVQFFRSINPGDGFFELMKILLLFSLFFQFTYSLKSGKKNKLLLFKLVGISTFIFLAIGLFQLWPALHRYFEKGIPLVINYEIASSLGNKNFLAETFLLMLPVLLLAMVLQTGRWRIFFILNAILIFIVLVVLQTLSTWLALTAMFVASLLTLICKRKMVFASNTALRRIYYAGAVLLMLFIPILFIFLYTGGAKNIQSRVATLKTLLNTDEATEKIPTQNSSYERIILWKNALRMIADKPVGGQGLGNYKINSPAYGTGSAEYMSSGVIRFVHPHNDFLFVAIELGMLGVLIYIAIFAFLIYRCILLVQTSKTFEELFSAIILLCGLVGYIIISMVSLPSSRIFPPVMFMLMSALIITTSPDKKTNYPLSTGTIYFIQCISLIAGVASIFIGNIRLKGELNVSKALLLERNKQYDAMGRTLDNINRTFLPVDVTATPVAWYQGYACFYTGNQEKAFDLFKEAYHVNPNHLMVLNDLGTSYNLHGDPRTARMFYDKALSIQPKFGESLINVAILQFNAGNLDSSYTFLLRNTGLIKPDKVNVFKTVFVRKAATVTNDTLALAAFESRLNNETSIMEVIKEINQHQGNLQPLLK